MGRCNLLDSWIPLSLGSWTIALLVGLARRFWRDDVVFDELAEPALAFWRRPVVVAVQLRKTGSDELAHPFEARRRNRALVP